MVTLQEPTVVVRRPAQAGRASLRGVCALRLVTAALAGVVPAVRAQEPAALADERAAFATWLESSALSPYAIVALQPVGTGISIGYEPSDVPLPVATRGVAREERGAVTLTQGNSRLTLPRGRPFRLERFTLIASGTRGRTVIAVYGPVRAATAPRYYPYAAPLSVTVPLEPPERRGRFRTLGLDGIESEATEAGFLRLTLAGAAARLRVYRIGAADDDEAELVVYFRDSTNGKGSYPAGRFVTLEPQGQGRFRIDFNRARNPFCAYSSAYPCPAPWPGNAVPAAIEAGERYHAAGGGAAP